MTGGKPRRYLTYENRAVVILCIVGGVAALDMLAFNFLGPFIATDLRLSNSQIGLIGGTGLLTWSLGAITSATLSDRLGRRRIFVVGALLCFAVFSTATAFATSFVTLIAARLLVGLSEGPIVPIQTAIMNAASTPHRRGVNMGIVQNLGSQLLGGIAGPLIMIGIATRLGWRNAFLVAALPALLLAVIVRCFIREPVRAVVPAARLPLGPTIRAIVAERNVRLCFVMGTCAIGWLATTTIFIPLWLIRSLHFSAGSMSVVMAWLGLGGAAASIIVPALSDRWGRRPVFVGFAVLGVVTPLGMVLGPASVPVLCAIGMVGSLFSGIMPLFIGIIPMESVAERYAATASSIVMGGAQIAGSLAGPLLAGVLADRVSPAAPFWLAAGLAVGAAITGLFLVETAPVKVARRVAAGSSRRAASPEERSV